MGFFTSVYDFAYQILADILSIDRLLVYKKLTAKIGLYFFLGGGGWGGAGVGVETTTYFTTFFESRKVANHPMKMETKKTRKPNIKEFQKSCRFYHLMLC